MDLSVVVLLVTDGFFTGDVIAVFVESLLRGGSLMITGVLFFILFRKNGSI